MSYTKQRDILEQTAEELQYHVDVDLDGWTPADINQWLSESVIGQSAATKAVSTLVYNTWEGRPSTMMLIGPSGCGKTEIFRALQNEMKNCIYVFDASQITPAGYRGTSLASMLYSTEQHKYDKRHLILVFDEIDKMLLSGEFGVLKAHELLKLLDQDILHLQTDDGKHQFTFDASCVSIVLVGAFTELRKQKAQHKPRIGFLSEPKPAPPSSAITMEDLIRAGVSPEICGRIQTIINLNAPSVELYHQIACKTVERISKAMDKEITVNPDLLDKLASEAIQQPIGARYIRNQIKTLIDNEIYYRPKSHAYVIGFDENETSAQYEELDALPL